MLHYRKKIAMALLQELGGDIGGTDFQKLLFLFCQRQSKPAYEFVPYKHGCFSFQSFADKRALMKRGLLNGNETRWVLPRTQTAYSDMLTDNDRLAIQRLVSEFRGLRGKRLLRYIYTEYPYFATKSETAESVLSKEELRAVERAMPKSAGRLLSTIGYEGKSIDGYLNALVLNGIQTLCDVRKNPLSMKYGFSKSQLARSAGSLGIEYVHFPQLGIESSARKDLHSQKDYDRLFAAYEKTTLARGKDQINALTGMLGKSKRIALTCFEVDPCKCHRTRVAAAVTHAAGINASVTQL